MNVEYIRLLMLYSDAKHPFVKAKADPSLSESLGSVARYFRDQGATRKLDNTEANRIMLLERHARRVAEKSKNINPDSLNERDKE